MPILSPATFNDIRNFIKLNTGLSFSDEKQVDLEYGLQNVAMEYGVTELTDFCNFLLNHPPTGELKHALQRSLTIGETYFFRERPILDKFRQLLMQIAPERRKQGKNLRIWSSGCSTGEEPYSIAIVIAECLPDLPSWSVTLIGSDINMEALQKARTGIYRNWSFRGLDNYTISKYFTKLAEHEYQVNSSIREMVEFSHINLFEDPYPSPLNKTYSLDFIFCRNVIMYFDDHGRKKVLGGFYNSLANKGHLFLSLTELAHQSDKRFVTCKDGSVVFYQKDIAKNSVPLQTTPVSIPKIAELETNQVIKFNNKVASVANKHEAINTLQLLTEQLQEVTRYQQAQLFDKAIGAAKPLIKEILQLSELPEQIIAGSVVIIESFAHQGALQEALIFTNQLLLIEKTEFRFIYLKGILYREMNSLHESEQAFKNCLFLEGENVAANFALAGVQRQQKKFRESIKSFRFLLTILEKKNPDETIPALESMPVRDLMSITKNAIENLNITMN